MVPTPAYASREDHPVHCLHYNAVDTEQILTKLRGSTGEDVVIASRLKEDFGSPYNSGSQKMSQNRYKCKDCTLFQKYVYSNNLWLKNPFY